MQNPNSNQNQQNQATHPNQTNSGTVNMALVKKLDVHTASSDFSKTYVFHDEDHTLGNSLRHVLMRNPDVEFCGYTIPHPSEPKMHLRLQTTNAKPADDMLQQGLSDLRDVSNAIADAYRKELKAFKRKHPNQKP